MAQPARIFVSHSHEDSAWCQAFVGALRQAGADVWYDEHDLGYGRLMDEIERELRARRTFLAVLSPAAVVSQWVRMEVNAAIRLHGAEPDRIVLPIIASKCDVPLLWSDYRWVSGPGDAGLPPSEAAKQVIQTLGLGVQAQRTWDEESVFAAFAGCCSPSGLQAARRLYDFAWSRGAAFSWGKGALPSVSAHFFIGPKAYSVFSLYEWPAGKASFALTFDNLLWGTLPLDALSRLAERLRTIPKAAERYAGLEQAGFKKNPSLSIDQILTQPGATDIIEAAIDELLQTRAG
jgi:hypothetical protein